MFILNPIGDGELQEVVWRLHEARKQAALKGARAVRFWGDALGEIANWGYSGCAICGIVLGDAAEQGPITSPLDSGEDGMYLHDAKLRGNKLTDTRSRSAATASMAHPAPIRDCGAPWVHPVVAIACMNTSDCATHSWRPHQ